jgi:glycosyltransferase involved in cell wall biosynthesis
MSAAPCVRRIAIVLQHASTGGWRYTCRLIEGLRQARPECEVTVYLGRAVNKVCELASPRTMLSELSAVVKPVPWLKSIRERSGLRKVVNKIRLGLNAANHRRWLHELDTFDTVLFAWPYGIECPKSKSPIAFVPHDFFYTHFIGSFIESPAACQSLRRQHARWLERAYPVVSTEFISDELKRTFPEYRRSPKVIRVSHLGSNETLSKDEASRIVRGLGIEGDFILSLNNLSPHKNLGQLLAGFHYVLREHPHLKLVLVGFGTDGIRGNANTPFYIDCVQSGGNVISLGLRRDREVSALISCSRMVVNASLYEAGNGSGLDAWAMGTPVAMSAIPSFLEQLQALDVRAETFNPRCCYEIRDAMLRILNQSELANSNSVHSQRAMNRYDWRNVASQYLQWFDEIKFGSSNGHTRIAS